MNRERFRVFFVEEFKCPKRELLHCSMAPARLV